MIVISSFLFLKEEIMSVDIESLAGSKMNMLTLLREGERRGKYKKRSVVCLCECGDEVEISLDQFIRPIH